MGGLSANSNRPREIADRWKWVLFVDVWPASWNDAAEAPEKMNASIPELLVACSIALFAVCFTVYVPNPDIGPGLAILFLLGPLGAILFSDALGGYTGPARGGYITTPTPGCVVKWIGWLLLVLVAMGIAVRSLSIG